MTSKELPGQALDSQTWRPQATAGPLRITTPWLQPFKELQALKVLGGWRSEVGHDKGRPTPGCQDIEKAFKVTWAGLGFSDLASSSHHGSAQSKGSPSAFQAAPSLDNSRLVLEARSILGADKTRGRKKAFKATWAGLGFSDLASSSHRGSAESMGFPLASSSPECRFT